MRIKFKNNIREASIKSTSIFTGAFAEILEFNTPILSFKDKSVGYWGDKSGWKLNFTTMDDTAALTAAVAHDDNAPEDLQIASFQISPAIIAKTVEDISGQKFNLHQVSGMEDFAKFLRKQRADNPAGENELYAKWQQGQYMYSMFSTQHNILHNNRYQDVAWTSATGFLGSLMK